MDTYIFGAKATAAGLYKALQLLEPEKKVKAFLVSDAEENCAEIWGCPVREISAVSAELTEEEKNAALVYGAVPELIHAEVRALLESYGFKQIIMLDSHLEATVMERYFEAGGKFRSVHGLELLENQAKKKENFPSLTVYAASFYRDSPLQSPPQMPPYGKKLYLGCDGAEKNGVHIAGQADFYDNTGDNISAKNPNRCEMTAHYWVWKNRMDTEDEYVGICHYRRILDLSEEDLKKMAANDVDVILPFPMLHSPSAEIQHTWYVPEADWILMKQVVCELYPEYGAVFDQVFAAPEFYNYNMLLAKKQVFADYCSWLFPVLDRLEELSVPKGTERHDRYTAYLSESLETLYFMANLKNLRIYHTGRLLFT